MSNDHHAPMTDAGGADGHFAVGLERELVDRSEPFHFDAEMGDAGDRIFGTK